MDRAVTILDNGDIVIESRVYTEAVGIRLLKYLTKSVLEPPEYLKKIPKMEELWDKHYHIPRKIVAFGVSDDPNMRYMAIVYLEEKGIEYTVVRYRNKKEQKEFIDCFPVLGWHEKSLNENG